MYWFLSGAALPLVLCGLLPLVFCAVMCAGGGLAAVFGLRGIAKSTDRSEPIRDADDTARR